MISTQNQLLPVLLFHGKDGGREMSRPRVTHHELLLFRRQGSESWGSSSWSNLMRSVVALAKCPGERIGRSYSSDTWCFPFPFPHTLEQVHQTLIWKATISTGIISRHYVTINCEMLGWMEMPSCLQAQAGGRDRPSECLWQPLQPLMNNEWILQDPEGHLPRAQGIKKAQGERL